MYLEILKLILKFITTKETKYPNQYFKRKISDWGDTSVGKTSASQAYTYMVHIHTIYGTYTT